MALIVGGTTVTATQTLDATTLTGNLPAISGASLTSLPASVPGLTDTGSFIGAGQVQGNSYIGGQAGSTAAGGNIYYVSFQGQDSQGPGSGTWRRHGASSAGSWVNCSTVWQRIS